MSLKDRLQNDMKAAMKEKEAGKVRLSVIRMVRAAIKNTEISAGVELSDEGIIDVLSREVKQRRDALAEFEKAGRNDLAESLQQEIAVLMEYLPEQLTEEEVRRLVQEAVTKVGAKEAKDMGKVMGVLMPQVKGKADGKLVNQVVREFLNG